MSNGYRVWYVFRHEETVVKVARRLAVGNRRL
jgi:hypothetical protein